MKLLLKLWLVPLTLVLLIPIALMSMFGYEKPIDDITEMFEA